MENRILTEKQKLFIDNLPDEILSGFYLAGGALVGYGCGVIAIIVILLF